VVAVVARANYLALGVKSWRDRSNAVKGNARNGLDGDLAIHIGHFLSNASGNERIIKIGLCI
jgi:hypothetical protein